MIEVEKSVHDLSKMFVPEYWGEAIPQVVSSDARISRSYEGLLSPIFRTILSGELSAITLGDGVVFEPTNPELTDRYSYHTPGTVLLVDTESLEPVRSYVDYTEEVENIPIAMSPRELMRSHISTFHDGTAMLEPDSIYLTDGKHAYARCATTVVIGTNRRGQPAVGQLFQAKWHPSKPKESDITRLSTLSDLVDGVGSVNKTYGYTDKTGLSHFKRVRSVEICKVGERERKGRKIPVFSFSGLGKLATSNV